MTYFILLGSLTVLSPCVLALLWRTVRGPGMADRLLAASMAATQLTFVLGIAGALSGSDLYYDAALVTALLSFSSTVIVGRFLMGKAIP